MTDRMAENSDFHLRLRIPGWLILAVIAVGLVFWGGRYAWDMVDSNADAPSGVGLAERITPLETSVEAGVLRASVLGESNEPFDPLAVSAGVTLDDATFLPAGVLFRGGGAWHGRSYVLSIEKAIPEGRTVATIRVSTRTAHWSHPVTAEDLR